MVMKININTKGTNISLTPAISEYIEKKVAMLEKFLKNTDEVLVNVEVGKTTKHHKSGEYFKAEFHVMENGNDHYAVAETEDLYASIDEVKDEIARKLSSNKKKVLHLFRKGSAMIKRMLRGEK